MTVNVNNVNQTYDITTTAPSTFTDLSSTLTKFPWWNDSNLAEALMKAVSTYFGYPNPATFSSDGPYFAYENGPLYFGGPQYFFAWAKNNLSGNVTALEPDSTPGITWATVVSSSVSTPEPATFRLLFVGLLGLGLLAGVKRYRGNRLQAQG